MAGTHSFVGRLEPFHRGAQASLARGDPPGLVALI
jgi:hypothetical protein